MAFPTASELSRLTALINRLLPLADVKRGDLITADNWNQVVGTLIELSQIVLAEGSNTSVLPHQHQDEVKLAWLEPSLRQLIQAGPISDPASKSALTNVERAVERLRERMIALDENLASLRKRMDEVRTLDLQRENEVIGIRRTIDGLADARKDVFDLRTSLDTIKAGINTTLEAADKLTVDDELVDFTTLLDRLGQMEELFNTLKLADGTLLNAQVLDNRLAEFANRYIDEEELQAVLENQTVEVPQASLDKIRDELEGSLLASAREELQASIQQLDDALREWTAAAIFERTSELDKRIRVNESLINESLAPLTNFNRLQLDYAVKFFEEQFGDKWQPPREILSGTDRLSGIVDSATAVRQPTDAVLTDSTLLANIEDSVRKQVEGMLPGAVDAAVAASVGPKLDTAVKSAVDAALKDQLTAAVNRAVQQTVSATVNKAVQDAVNSTVNKAVEEAVQSSLKEVSGQLREFVQVEVKRQIGTAGSGTTESRADLGGIRRLDNNDDLTRISGLGSTLVQRLNEKGITSFKQLASADAGDLAKILRRPLADAERIISDAKRLA